MGALEKVQEAQRRADLELLADGGSQAFRAEVKRRLRHLVILLTNPANADRLDREVQELEQRLVANRLN